MIKGILTQNTVYHDKNEIHNKFVLKRFFPKNQNKHPVQVSRISEMPSTNILNESIPVHTYGLLTTMFRASALKHRQHKHPSCRLCYRHALYQHAFALKTQELWTKNVLEWLETRNPSSSSKSYELKTNYTHCTYNFNA